MSTDKLYQLKILEYASRKDLKEEIEDPTDIHRGNNPNCGDDLSIVLKIDKGIIEKASYIGQGCAISCASSGILVELIKGKSLEYAKNLVDIFFKMMISDKIEDKELEILNDASMLHILKDMPSRIKCATLSWHSLDFILKKYNKV